MIARVVYLLCALTSGACAVLLVRAFRRAGGRLLLLSAVCFVGLALNNAMLVVDRLVVPHLDLSTWRLVPALAGMAALVFGLVWDRR